MSMAERVVVIEIECLGADVAEQRPVDWKEAGRTAGTLLVGWVGKAVYKGVRRWEELVKIS